MGSREPDGHDDAVWIVQHDESPHNTVVGVFRSQSEAAAFAEEAQDRFINGLLYSRFPVGYRYDRSSGHATFTPRP